jgi:hypothetical protein
MRPVTVDRAPLLCTSRSGRSVLVKGVVHELNEGDRHAEELDVVAAGIRPWAGGAQAHIPVVTPVSGTGRRIVQE